MKIFTLHEANLLLHDLIPKLRAIRDSYVKIDGLREPARMAASASEAGGGMAGGSQYIRLLYNVGKLTSELQALGVELKDHSRGLIDFPFMRKDRIAYLCWQFDDGDEIHWWHEIDGGFAGRKLL